MLTDDDPLITTRPGREGPVPIQPPAVFGDRSSLTPWAATRAVAGCAVRTGALLLRRRLRQPRRNVGRIIRFPNGTSAAVYRETVIDRGPTRDPVFLVVGFRLRLVRRPWAHALFRAESMLNTVLFAGFPGLVSKLWLRHDQEGVYRGLYEWDGPELALAYVNALWWVLALVCDPGSIRFAVIPGTRRDEALASGRVDVDVGGLDGSPHPPAVGE